MKAIGSVLLWAVIFWAACVAGCGGEEAPPETTYSDTGGLCYQEADWVFSAYICPGRQDIGVCSWSLPDGRTLHPFHCITQRGVTCLETCDGVR